MKIFYSRRRQRVFIIIIILLAVLVIYLNRTYAHIYNTIGRAALRSSDSVGVYMLKPILNSGHSSSPVSISSASSSTPLVYVALGDSLAAGVGTQNYKESYPYLVANDLASGGRLITLHDRGIPGERSAGLIKNLLPLAIKDRPNIITLFIGINDIHGLISTAVFQKNYDLILRELTQKTTAKIYVINLPYLGSPNLIRPPYNYVLNWRTQEFNKIIKDLATKYSVNYIDLYTPTLTLFKKAGPWYAADSFHPSPLGYKFWTKIIYANIHK